MKYTFIIMLAFFAMSCGSDSKSSDAIKEGVSATGAHVKVTHETTKAELIALKKNLFSNTNSILSYDGSTFFENDKINYLDLAIKLSNGAGGKTKASNAQLKESAYGFIFEITDQGPKMVRMGKFD